jgi:putative ABC transport system permease protein
VSALRENPLRTVLSTLGVIIGVASLVAVLSLGDTLQAFAKLEIDRITDAQSITIESRTWHVVDSEWAPIRNVARLSESDFDQLVAALPEARASWMTRTGSTRVAYRKTGVDRNAGISAVSAGILAMDKPRLAAGRSFSPREAAVNAAVVVLSHRLAEELADGRPAESMIGKEVRVGAIPREVIGVFERTPGERSYSARIPLAGAAATFPAASMEQPASITLRARDLEDVPALRSGVEDWLAQRYIGWEEKFELVLAEQMRSSGHLPASPWWWAVWAS